MTQVDVAALRTLLSAWLVSGTHKEITERFADLGLAEFAGVGEKSKANRVREVLENSSDDALAAAAERLLAAGGIGAGFRNQIQDALWAAAPQSDDRKCAAISQRVDRCCPGLVL